MILGPHVIPPPSLDARLHWHLTAKKMVTPYMHKRIEIVQFWSGIIQMAPVLNDLCDVLEMVLVRLEAGMKEG